MIRAYRLALGIALADVVAQVRARYEADGRRVPRFSETLLSAYESGQKRPGPEYLHYLCATYQADPADLGLDGSVPVRRLPPMAGTAPRTRSPSGAGPGRRARRRAEPGRRCASGSGPGADGPAGRRHARRRWPAPSADEDDDMLRRMLIRQMTAAGCRVDGRFLGAVDRIRRRLDDALCRRHGVRGHDRYVGTGGRRVRRGST